MFSYPSRFFVINTQKYQQEIFAKPVSSHSKNSFAPYLEINPRLKIFVVIFKPDQYLRKRRKSIPAPPVINPFIIPASEPPQTQNPTQFQTLFAQSGRKDKRMFR